MAKYNAVAGVHQKELNRIFESVYGEAYDVDLWFKGQLDVGQFNIKGVAYDIQEAPVITLGPCELLRAIRTSCLEAALSGDNLRAALDETEQADLSLSFGKVALTINWEDDTETSTSGSIQACGMVQADLNGSVTIQVLSGNIDIPNEPTLSDILNKGFLPKLIEYLNENIFTPFQIPPLGLKGVELSMPALLTQNDWALGFLTLRPSEPAPPGPGNWPVDKVFVGCDSELLDAVAKAALPPAEDKWHWSRDIGMCKLVLDASCAASVSVRFGLEPPSNITLSGTATATASFSGKCGFLSLSPRATAKAKCTATVSVSVQNSVVYLIIEHVNVPSFDFRFEGVPWWLPALVLDLIADSIAPFLSELVNRIFQNPIRLYAINPISVPINGRHLMIGFRETVVSVISGSDGRDLLTVSCSPEVTIATVEARVTGVTRTGETEERK